MQRNAKKYIGGLLVGILLLGGSGIALAGNSTTSTQPSNNSAAHGSRIPSMGKVKFQLDDSILASLVSAGTITQNQSDQIKAKAAKLQADRQTEMNKIKAMTEEERQAYFKNNKPKGVNLLTALVNDGTITQAQADAIKKAEQTAISSKMTEQRKAKLTSSLSGLVDEKIITADQSAAILTKLYQSETDRQAEMSKLKTMTKEQRQAYMKSNKSDKNQPLADLVADGTLTQEQADQVLKAIRPFNGLKGVHQGRGGAGCQDTLNQ